MTNAATNVLVADDEPAIRQILRTMLGTQGYQVREAADGKATLEAVTASPASDVLLLDLALPDMDGVEIIRIVRGLGISFPIIVLSNRGDEPSKVKALDSGANDYVTKPFGAQELFARIRASIRARPAFDQANRAIRTGDLSIELISRTVRLGGKEIRLSPKEYALLSYLAKHAGKVVTHGQILKEVWGEETDPQYIRIYVRLLRQKLRDAPENPRYILTEQGIGYRFADED